MSTIAQPNLNAPPGAADAPGYLQIHVAALSRAALSAGLFGPKRSGKTTFAAIVAITTARKSLAPDQP
jgi:hypothetical protein